MDEGQALSLAEGMEVGGDVLAVTLLPPKGPDHTVEILTAKPPDEWAAHLALLESWLGSPIPKPMVEEVEPAEWMKFQECETKHMRFGRLLVGLGGLNPAGRHRSLRVVLTSYTAFGTGEHPTTDLCLRALDRLSRTGYRPSRVLDMGCGSGLLALASRRLWPRAKIMACDNDREAVRVSTIHAKRNGSQPYVEMVYGDGYHARQVKRAAPHDVILANILARPLTKMARHLRVQLAPGGYVILSGILAEQEKRILSAHRMQGLYLVRRLARGPWRALVLRRKNGRHKNDP